MNGKLQSIFTETQEFLDLDKLWKDYEYIGKSDNKLRFVKKEDYSNSRDLNVQTVCIQNNPVEIDILLAPLIEFLNECRYKTEYCCSGHYINDSIWMKDNSDNIYVLYRHIKNYMDSGYISFKKKYPKLKKVLLKHGLPLVTKNSDIAKIKFDNKSYYLYIDEAPFIDEEPKSKPHNLIIRWQFGDNITENDIIYSVTEISKMIHNIMICNMI